MNRQFLSGALLLAILLTASPARSQDGRGLGLGVVVNNPTGFTAKGFVSEHLALDAAFTFAISEFNSLVYLHSNLLVHVRDSEEHFRVEEGELLPYYGAGMRLQWSDLAGDVLVGLRGPLGLTYFFENNPVEVFIELAPTLDVNPIFEFRFGGGFGVRYYMN